jgi:hypothetical protein
MIPTTAEHIEFIAEHMRAADVEEIWASGQFLPLRALRLAVLISEEALTGMADGVPICIFGVGRKSLLDTTGIPWLLGTDAIERHAKGFMQRNRTIIKAWRERYELLENWVDSRNTKSVAWLRWLGFTIQEASPYGAFGLPFHHFEMRRSDV